jgi:PAS domain S-box-containing protein
MSLSDHHNTLRDSESPSGSGVGDHRTLFLSLEMGVLYQGTDGRFIDANPAAVAILGVTVEEMRLLGAGRHWRAIREDGTPFPEEEFPGRTALRSRAPVLGTIMGVVRERDHRTRWIRVDSFPEFLDGGPEPSRVVSTIRDVTDERHADIRAQQWSRLFEHSDLAFAIADARTNALLAVNRAFAEQRGYVIEELVGRPIIDICAPEARDEMRSRFPNIDRDGHLVFESVHMRKDGSRLPVLIEATTTRGAGGEPVTRVAYALDITARKQAEEALRASEARLQRASASGNVGLWDWDLTTNAVYFSPEWKRQIGYEDHEIPNEFSEWEQRLHPDDAAAAVATVLSFLGAPAGAHSLEFRFQHKDGSYRWILAYASTEWDADGRPVRMLGSHLDITDRKAAEEALRQRNEQLEQASRLQTLSADILEILNDPVALADSTQRILLAIKMTTGFDAVGIRLKEGADFPYAAAEGFSQEFLVAENTLLPPVGSRAICTNDDGTPRLECTCGLVLAGHANLVGVQSTKAGTAWTNSAGAPGPDTGFDARARPRDRCLHEGFQSVALIPIRLEGEIVGLLQLNDRRAGRFTTGLVEYLESLAASFGVALGRKRDEEALRSSSSRYRHLLETTADWIWEIDQHGRYTFASDRVRELLGYEPEEIIGRTPFDLMPPDEAARVGPLFQRVAAAREAFTGLENTAVHKDGSLVDLETSGVPILGPSGEYRGYRGMDRNVSERKRLGEQLRQSQRLKAVGELAGGIAHDFNNILAATMMHIGLLQAVPDLDPDTRQGLEEIDRESQRAAALVRQLLMFSRRSLLEVRPLDLNDIVTNLLKMLGRIIGEQVALEFESRTSSAGVEADAGMLEQVVVNLVVNARDAMPRGGLIRLVTDLATIAAEDVRRNPSRRAGTFVCLSVADRGIGMDAATLERIFEPFFTTKDAGSGTGLGLAVAHGIVAQHQGWIEVDSRPGEGATFRVYLPFRTSSRRAASAARPAAAVRGGEETILLVEDEARVRRLVARLLKDLGYRVLEAANGREALRVWQEHSAEVALLFTDMVMPEGMTGLELCERLHAQKPELRAIISSGYSAEIIAAGLPTRAGVVYLPKPYDVSLLGRVVRECLDRA